MKVTCNICGEEFKAKLKVKSFMLDSNEIAMVYFLKCPMCKKKYLSYVQTQELRKRQEKVSDALYDLSKRIMNARNGGLPLKDRKQLENDIREVRQKEDELKKDMQALKEKYKDNL